MRLEALYPEAEVVRVDPSGSDAHVGSRSLSFREHALLELQATLR